LDTGLESLGWDAGFAAAFAAAAAVGTEPARVVAEQRERWRVASARGERWAEPSGRLRRAMAGGDGRPAVGDWVVVRPGDERDTLVAILPRRSRVARAAAGRRTEAHVLCANVDILFVATSVDRDFNLRRLERYLVLAADAGATPVVLLTKADCGDAVAPAAAVAAIAPGVAVHAVAAPAGIGLDAVRTHLGRGRTAVVLGSSGVGKSTLVNALLGAARFPTAAVRDDDSRGRHTTASRQLVVLPADGGLIVDTPGLRALQPWDAVGLATAFADVAYAAARCRFADCRHEAEPGCAVRAALDAGRLSPERLASFRKLERESEHLQARQDATVRHARRERERRLHRVYDRTPKRQRDGSR
jgi:ribosome biogenesis GTPase